MTRLESVLITGGAGFVGSHAAEYYAEHGTETTILDNFSGREMLEHTDEGMHTSTFNRNYLESKYPQISVINADIRDRGRLFEAADGVDGIIHLAGQVAVTSSLDHHRADFEINAGGTLNVLEAAKHSSSDPAVVFASTNKVYGDNVNGISVTEGETRYRYADPEYTEGVPESFSIDDCEHTPYGVSKLAGDMYVQDYAYRTDIDAATFRMSCIYGPRQFGNEDQGWVAHFALSTLRDEPLKIFGNGKQVRDILYVNDLIRAYDAFLSDPIDKSTIYNIGGGPNNTVSLLEYLELLEEKTGNRPEVTFADWREGDQRVYISDVSRATKELDWEPTVGPEEGVENFVNWYRKRIIN